MTNLQWLKLSTDFFDNNKIKLLESEKDGDENRSGFKEYKYLADNKVIISSKGVEWICKNIFKQKYFELLEKYKKELTELYIKAGYPYDYFFGRN